jgi:hypothetical protein
VPGGNSQNQLDFSRERNIINNFWNSTNIADNDSLIVRVTLMAEDELQKKLHGDYIFIRFSRLPYSGYF